MKVFSDTVQFRKSEEGAYTISIAVNDNTLVIKALNKRDLVKILSDVQKLIEEE